MSGLETAIRQALERSDRASAETRARIYQSARNALEAGLRKQNVNDDAVISQQRHRLELTIHAIEQQERLSLREQASVDAPAAARDRDPVVETGTPLMAGERRDGPDTRPMARRHSEVDEPVVAEIRADGRFGDRPDGRRVSPAPVDAVSARVPSAAQGGPRSSTPAIDSPMAGLRAERSETWDAPSERQAGPSIMVAPDHDTYRPGAEDRDTLNDLGLPGAEPLVPRRRRGRGGRIASVLMVTAVLVAAIGSAVWWVMSTGLLEPSRTGPAPSPSVAAEDFDGGAGLKTLGAQAGFTADWVDLYLPSNAGAVTPSTRARAEIVEDEGGQRLRITSADGDATGNIAITVPPAALQRMAGQTSTIALSVQSSTGKPTQFSVECDFVSLGDCGRHRFTVNDEKSDMLFKVTFDRTLSPNGPGRILVNSDVTGESGGLDLYAVRLLPGQ